MGIPTAVSIERWCFVPWRCKNLSNLLGALQVASCCNHARGDLVFRLHSNTTGAMIRNQMTRRSWDSAEINVPAVLATKTVCCGCGFSNHDVSVIISAF